MSLMTDLGLMREAPAPPRPRDAGDWVERIEWAAIIAVAAVLGAMIGAGIGTAAVVVVLEAGILRLLLFIAMAMAWVLLVVFGSALVHRVVRKVRQR